ASGISSLQTLVATHSRVLSRSDIDFAAPFLAQSLRERAFASVVRGVEETTALACQKLAAVANGVERAGSEQSWDQLAVPTRPPLDLPDTFAAQRSAADPVELLDCYRVSPVGLLQYPLWAQLLHSFRECLHSLRILVLASDSAVPACGNTSEALVLLSMVSIVLESELIRTATALASLCEQSLPARARQAARDACVAFVFGLVRNAAEIFEEVTTLCEDSTAVGSSSEGQNNSVDPTVTLYSEAIYAPLVHYI
ncbi:hypothetical protein IWW38_003786, partial [Coemansia aciculifera]